LLLLLFSAKRVPGECLLDEPMAGSGTHLAEAIILLSAILIRLGRFEEGDKSAGKPVPVQQRVCIAFRRKS
jgi:hypothetical protein